MGGGNQDPRFSNQLFIHLIFFFQSNPEKSPPKLQEHWAINSTDNHSKKTDRTLKKRKNEREERMKEKKMKRKKFEFKPNEKEIKMIIKGK